MIFLNWFSNTFFYRSFKWIFLFYIGIRDFLTTLTANKIRTTTLHYTNKNMLIHRPMTHIFLQRWSSNPEIGWTSKVVYMIIALTAWFKIIPGWIWFAHRIVRWRLCKMCKVKKLLESIGLGTHHLLLFAQLPLSPFRSDLIEQHVDIFLIQNIYWLITFSQVLFFNCVRE